MRSGVPIEKIEQARGAINLGLGDGTVTPHGTLLIREVKSSSSLGKAGLKSGDEIVTFGPISGGDMETGAWAVVAEVGIGGTIPVQVRRAGKLVELRVVLIAKKSLSLSLEDVDLALERKIAP